MIILARLRTPQDYGVVGLVLTFTGFAAIFVDLGLTPAVLQKQGITQTELSTAFWINNAMGWTMLALLWMLAEAIATFYKEPLLIWVTRITAFSFVLTPLISLPRALMERKLRFRVLTKVNVAALVVSSGVAICFAAKGFGYWSLVAQTLAVSAANALGPQLNGAHLSPSAVLLSADSLGSAAIFPPVRSLAIGPGTSTRSCWDVWRARWNSAFIAWLRAHAYANSPGLKSNRSCALSRLLDYPT
jgi:hypothetical protein